MVGNNTPGAVWLARTDVEEYQYSIDPDAIDRLAAGLEQGHLLHGDGPDVARQQATDLRRMAAELRLAAARNSEFRSTGAGARVGA